MAIFDLNDPNIIKHQNSKEYDFAILGCGVVGTFAALELINRGKKVVIFESGAFGESDQKQKLNLASLNRKDLEGSVHWGRKRALGGTGIAWGGQALRFSKADFISKSIESKRPKWLVTYEDLERNYEAAEKYLKIGDLDYFNIKPFKQTNLNSFDKFDIHLSKWSRRPDMFSNYRTELLSNCDVYYNAHCIEAKTENRSCKSIIVSNDNGQTISVDIINLILANGGLESVRFLLLHFKNASQHIGEGFMEHPCIKVASINHPNPALFQKIFGVKLYRRNKYGIRVSVSEKELEDQKNLNASFSFMFESMKDSFDVYREARKAFSTSGLLKLIFNIPTLSKVIANLLFHKTIFRPEASTSIVLMAEQEWSPDSKLTLDSVNKDKYGQAYLKVEWQISDKTIDSIKHYSSSFTEQLKQNFPKLKIENISTEDDNLKDKLTPVNHHMGGASMGLVVSDTLKLNNYSNVYVYSSAVFASSSHSNPTLTTLALVHRSICEICAD